MQYLHTSIFRKFTVPQSPVFTKQEFKQIRAYMYYVIIQKWIISVGVIMGYQRAYRNNNFG